MADKEYIEREALDDFKDDLMGRFIVLCFGNDYNKLQLLTIGNVIDELYEKHSTKPTADVVEVVRCKDCKHLTVYNARTLYAYCEKTHFRFEPFQTDTRTHFCGFGAKMDGKDDEA